MNNFFKNRFYNIITIIILVGLIYIIKLFFLQIANDYYKKMADENTLRYIINYPDRGLIYDRNDSLLVYNELVYDLMVVPGEMKTIDTFYLCKFLEIDKLTLMQKIEKAKLYSTVIPSVIASQLSKEDVAALQEKLYQFPGFFIQSRTLRYYPKPVAAHILGYVGEINQEILENDFSYKLGDYIGLSGIEKYYEKELRGEKGMKIVLVDVKNRERGRYKNGEEDVVSVSGTPLWSTLDIDLQQYGEMLMSNKRGSIVAIEPKTGEILCVVSSPSYDPNLLVGKNRSKNYLELVSDLKNKPLFNRALQAIYPPGSTFKLLNGLVAQKEEVLDKNTVYYCQGGYIMDNHKVNCHHAGSTNLVSAIQHSCNNYFCKAFYNIVSNKKKYKTIQQAYQAWKDQVNLMGFGTLFNTDLPFETKGIIPSVEYFDRKYNKQWNGNTIVSMGIGQGEAATTPLQMANLLAIIANRGYYIKPHIIRAIRSADNLHIQFTEQIDVKIDKKYFEPVLEGMELAVQAGTARSAQIKGVRVAGKTGTAQNAHGKDHSVFAAIAPVDDPQIAIFVLVENGGWGASVAAPIARLMMEKYLKKEPDKATENNIINMIIN